MQLRFLHSLHIYRELIWQLAERDVNSRYKGSMLGWSWSLVQPLLTLCVYSFVFSQIFRSRWEGSEGGIVGYAVNLFAGLITFGIFSESLNKSPDLVSSQPSYVKKIVFPVEILPVVNVTSTTFHSLTGVAILALFQLISWHHIPITILWLPIVWLPLLGLCLTCSWVLAAIGVFIRDTSQIIGVVTSLLMFLSAVIYPASALPERWQMVARVNPLITIIEETRKVAIHGSNPSPLYLTLGLALSIAGCELGFRIFQKAQRGFADVI